MKETAVNIDYICLIREIDGKTSFETIDIPAYNTSLISRLEQLAENDDSTELDMQKLMNSVFYEKQRKPIDYIAPHSYADTFIDIVEYPNISLSEYEELIENKTDTLRKYYIEDHQQEACSEPRRFKNALKKYLEAKLKEYKAELKNDYLEKAKRFICAANYVKTLDKVKRMRDVRMYSTDTHGWSNFSYKVTEDVAIDLKTNFGYGNSSYFGLGLRYKGIDILPYSYLVRYYYAEMRDLLRYTRLFRPSRDSWNTAFNFIEETANRASDSPEEFVSQWILGEVYNMVECLHVYLDEPQYFIHKFVKNSNRAADCNYLTVRNMNNEEKDCYGVFPEEMTLAICAEKVTGALDFLENLSQLSTLVPEINHYIKEIKEMAIAVIPKIDAMVKQIKCDVIDSRKNKKKLETEMAVIKDQIAPYETIISEIYWNLCFESEDTVDYHKIEEDYATKDSKYAKLKDKKDEMQNKLKQVTKKITMQESFVSHLKSCRERVSNASLI